MAQINLLPWREQYRDEQKRQFFVVLAGSVVAAIAIVVLMHLMIATRISRQLAINEFLRQEIVSLDKQIEEIKNIKEQKNHLIARMEMIQHLQLNRPLVVRLFDELVQIIPEGIHINDVKKEGPKITLTGYAESNTRVSELMRNIEASAWFTAPALTEIKNDRSSGEKTRIFQLEMIQVLPKSKLIGEDDGDRLERFNF